MNKKEKQEIIEDDKYHAQIRKSYGIDLGLKGRYAIIKVYDYYYQVMDWEIIGDRLQCILLSTFDGMPVYRLVVPASEVKIIKSMEDQDEFAEFARDVFNRLYDEYKATKGKESEGYKKREKKDPPDDLLMELK